jgi:hypothetical protein
MDAEVTIKVISSHAYEAGAPRMAFCCEVMLLGTCPAGTMLTGLLGSHLAFWENFKVLESLVIKRARASSLR